MAGVLSRLRQNRGKPRFWDVAKALGFANNVVHITDFDTRPEGYKTFNGVQSYDIGNPAALEPFHKDNAAFTILSAIKITNSTAGILGNRANSNTNIGFQFNVNATRFLQFVVSNGSAAVRSELSSFTIALDTWSCAGISVNEATGAGGIIYQDNLVFDTDTSTYVSPSASNGTHAFRVGGVGIGNYQMPAGTRMAGLIALNAAMTQQNMTDFYTLIAPRMRG